ncbi:MAG: glucans biosynthesis glucosyltransferase MdoH [Pseudomonadota bacterium]
MSYAFADMPKSAPLPMARQDFRAKPSAHPQPKSSVSDRAWRLAAFAPAGLITLTFTIAIARWLAHGGVTVTEAVIVVLVALTFIWVSLTATAVLLGVLRRPTPLRLARGAPQRVALLMPIHNETPADVFGNAWAMLQDLRDGPQHDAFALFILSDTTDPEMAQLEERAYWAIKGEFDVYYRRRSKNRDRKVGNVSDWIENWGAAFDAMVVLDADSLMSGAAIRHLARAMAADPRAGLIQSFPSLIGARTLFGRMQQFSNAVYGWLLAEGLAVWAQSEGNYWGHNAIIRVRAFAESAHLPHLRGRRGRSDLILSHDFVEAGLLRRAGWSVRFEPRVTGSFEETPQTLIDYALRDRRWCQGNLQHLRLLTARGFHPVSRFHLLQGAFAFLLSPAWFVLLVIWSLAGTMPESSIAYFNPSAPLYPIWPEAPGGGAVFLAFIYGMLLFTKLMGTVFLGFRRPMRADYGGWGRYLSTMGFEIACSILYAPIMMVQQTQAVFRALFGLSRGWAPQNRGSRGYRWSQVFRFHWIELSLGVALVSGIAGGAMSFWLAPIALSLSFAPILSKLSEVEVANRKLGFARLDAPQDLREPRIVTRARARRASMEAHLAEQDAPPLAAE